MEDFRLPPEDLEALRRIAARTKGPAHEWKRARYLVLLHGGEIPVAMICRCLDIRRDLGEHWRKRYEHDGLAFIRLKDYSAREGHLSRTQEEELRETLRDDPLHDTNAIRAHIQSTYGQGYSRSGCIKLLHRLGFDYKKPGRLPAQADEQKQRDFITGYEKLLNNLEADEVVYFGDAVHIRKGQLCVQFLCLFF